VNFTTSFTFRLTAAVADGFTYTIQGNSPTTTGLRGNGLGYEIIRNSAAINFKIYQSNSTGIFTDGRNPSQRAPELPPDVPDRSVDLTGTGVDLHSGHVHQVDVTYDGAVMLVTITDTETSASASQTYLIDLRRFIGGNFAYHGFTGGTGGLSATQDILTWTYQGL
jgi:hypothetical protein